MIKTHLPACIFILMLSVLVSCSTDKPAQTTAIKKNTKTDYILLPDSIYRVSAINAALKNSDQLQKNESRKLFMKGLDLLANKNDAGGSIEYFKEAIYYYPEVKNYEYLFQAYLKMGYVALADSVNETFYSRIDYELATFNAALIAAVTKDTLRCVGLLEEAAMAGFPFKDRIVKEPLFAFLEDDRSYQGFLLASFGNDQLIRKRLFKSFARSFPDLDLPFYLPVDSVTTFNDRFSISYDFSEFVPGMDEGRFSRDVEQYYSAIGKFSLENGVALLYKTSDVFADTLNPAQVHLMIYDTLGNMLSTTPMACFCSPLESKSLLVRKDHSIEVKSYQSVWESDPLEKGYAGNRVVSRKESMSFNYIISEGNKLKTKSSSEDIAVSGQ